jgi:hypothetical protein
MAKKSVQDIVRNMPELEENSDTRTVPERISDFLNDFSALTYVDAVGGISTMLSQTSTGLLIAIIGDFEGELQRRIEDREATIQETVERRG